MPLCFWKLCSCPSAHPCAEHDGVGCSNLNGVNITKLEDVVDALTHEAELGIVRMDQDQQRIDAYKAQLEARQQELQNAKDDLERQMQSASTIGQRKAAWDAAKQINDKYANVDAELHQIEGDLAVLAKKWDDEIAKVTGKMIVPYVDPTGYCACYQRKLRRLTFINSLIGPLQTQIGAINAQISAVKARVAFGYTQITAAKIAFSSIGLAVIVAFIVFGIAGAVIVACIGLLIMNIWAISLLLQLISLSAQRRVLQRQILQLALMYYRMQQIPTCITDDDDDDDDEDGGEEDNGEDEWHRSVWRIIYPE